MLFFVPYLSLNSIIICTFAHGQKTHSMTKLFEDKKISGQVTLRTKKTTKGQSLYLDIYKDGVRHKEYLKMYLVSAKTPEDKITNKVTWDAAQAIGRERAQSIVKGKAGIKESKSKILLLDWMNKRVEQLAHHAKEIGRKRSNTATLVRNATLHLETYIRQKYGERAIRLSDVDRDFCIGYGEYLCTAMGLGKKHGSQKPLSSTTRELYYKVLSAALNVAMKDGHIQHNPMLLINRTEIIGKSTPNERVYLTADELQKLISTPCRRDDVRDAFLFSCMCGLRWSDIANLKWGNIHTDGDNWRIEIKMIKTFGMLYLPLNNEAKSLLPTRNEAPGTANVFKLPSIDSAERALKKWVEDAGLTKHVTFHCARHTFATLMLTQGADLYTTSKLLGHSDIKTTQIYAKIVDKKKTEAVNLLNGLFNVKGK